MTFSAFDLPENQTWHLFGLDGIRGLSNTAAIIPVAANREQDSPMAFFKRVSRAVTILQLKLRKTNVPLLDLVIPVRRTAKRNEADTDGRLRRYRRAIEDNRLL